MKQETKNSVKALLLEAGLYAGLVAAYYFLVLHFLGDGLKRLYTHDRNYYAALSLGLIVGQGFLLEVVTRMFLTWIKPRTEDG